MTTFLIIMIGVAFLGGVLSGLGLSLLIDFDKYNEQRQNWIELGATRRDDVEAQR